MKIQEPLNLPFSIITICRVCASGELSNSISLGNLASCGFFPKTKAQQVGHGFLNLLVCNQCGLVQLDRDFETSSLFGVDYGYESKLNASMVLHLNQLAKEAYDFAQASTSVRNILDIGSNDGTFLNWFAQSELEELTLVGIDPAIDQLAENYASEIVKISDFFSADLIRGLLGDKIKFDLITSIAMFYDLPNPNAFVKEISDLLAENGTWVFELTTVETILSSNAFDSICHEHLEYYNIESIEYLLQSHGLVIDHIKKTAANGGSLRVYTRHQAESGMTRKVLSEIELKRILNSLSKMKIEVDQNIELLRDSISERNTMGLQIHGLGASTKGNTFLQYSGIDSRQLPFIAEVNPMKFGCFTPGSLIPIISENESLKEKPGSYLVLPWHFRENLIAKNYDFLEKGGEMIFALPSFDVIKRA
jgi:SAM-dependent methyltransferase